MISGMEWLRRLAAAAAVTVLLASAAAAQQPATPPQSYVVYFDFGSSKLSMLARPVIAEAAAAIRRGQQDKSLSHVKVIGYSDTAGSDESADRISRERADAVRSALVREGIAGDFVTTEGRGKHELAVPTSDHVRNPRNRRVRIMLYRPGD